MVTPSRDENGKFLPKFGGEAKPNGEGDSTNAGSATNGDSGETIGIIDPASIDNGKSGSDENSAGEPKRKRGRPAGGGKQKEEVKRPETSGKLDLDSLNFTLFYAHTLVANVMKTPELALDEQEAKSMATAAMNVMQHYNIKASQKAIDWGNLLFTCVIIYGGKIHKAGERIAADKKAKKAAKEAVAAPFFGNHSVTG